MKVCFIAAGPIQFASARMRAHWIAPYMEDGVVTEWEKAVKESQIPYTDAYIFQKNADPQVMRNLVADGHQVWWDVCDPAWWWSPGYCQEIADIVTGAVASNEALAADYTATLGKECHVIPDRLEPLHFNKRREHQDTKPVKLIWYGLYVNRMAIYAALANLERLTANGYDIQLTIMDDQPGIALPGPNGSFPIAYVRWQLDREVDIIASHDIALLPPYPGPWGKVKSDNKMLTALACGLSSLCGTSYAVLEDFVQHPDIRPGVFYNDTPDSNVWVAKSAQDWEALLCGS